MGSSMLDLKLILPEEEKEGRISQRDEIYNIIIIGGGPAGMTSAVYAARKQIKTLNVEWLSHRVTAIHGEKYVTGASVESVKTKEVKDLNVQGVFIEIGLIPNSEFAKGFVLQNTLGEIVVDCSCQTSIPGVFAAGDVTTIPDKQISIAIGEGSKAALSAYKYLLTEI